MLKKINPEKFYTPKDIDKLGIMTAKSSDTRRQMLLRYIRDGRIKATNLGGEKKPRYIVQGKHLVEYLDTQMKPGEYANRGIFRKA